MAVTATAPPDLSAEVTAGVNPWLIATAVMLATFMEVLDTAIASVALPYIAGSLSATTDEATWVLTSYLVANAIVLPASNWCSLKFGRKRFLLSCVAIFTLASFACGAAPTLAFILFARVVQGAGGGALQPLSQAILLESFPPRKRGAAMALFGFGVVVAPVLGPTLGGWLTDTYSWRYAFYINIPVGLLALYMINRFVHDPPYIKHARVPAFDNLGFGALVVWTGLLQIILDKGQESDWFGATWIRWAFFFLITSFSLFVWHSWRKHEPMVDLKLLKNRNFAVGCLLIFSFGIALYSTIVVLPLFYQELLGYTAFTAGLVVAPRGIGTICGLPAMGYLSNKVDPRYLLTFGFSIFCISTLTLSNINLGISPTTLLVPIIVTGFGISFVFVPTSIATVSTLRNEQMGNASGIFNLMRNIGGSIGISIAQTMLTRHTAAHQNEILNSVPLTSRPFQNSLTGARHALTNTFGPANTLHPAQSLIYGELHRQAALWAFVDVLRWLSLLGFVCLAIAWLLKKVPLGHQPPAVH
jgi:DHA2 family multidrug resistance protein